MPAPSQITVSLPIGPGLEATSEVLTNVLGVDFQLSRGILRINRGNGQITDYDLNPADTVTFTIADSEATIVVSQP